MILKSDKEKLDRILYDYSKLTGLSIALLDDNSEYIASAHPSGFSFCTMLQERDNSYRCRCSDTEIIEKCQKSGKAEMHICHAGLCDMAIPIISDRKIIAYIILGRIKCRESFDDIAERLAWFSGDSEKLREEYSRLVYYDGDSIKSVANIAVAVAAYILGDGVIKPQHNAVAEKAARFIEENMQQEITVSILCRELGVSKNLLYETFAQAFGCTVKAYVTEKRVSHAAKLLADTDASVCEIADKVGIQNYTYFCRLAKQKLGMSPLQYRKTKRTSL